MRLLAFASCLFFVVACSTEEPVTEADKTVVLRAAELARFGYRFDNIEALETFTRKRHLDGTSEIAYRFQSPPGSKVLFLHVSVKVAKSESDAAFTQGAEKVGLMIGFKKSGVEERELAAPPAGKLSLLVKDERPIGNIFTASHGGKTFLLVMTGLYFDDPALWQKVIEPSMSRFRAYQAL
ncbi:MAG TPA: hypothetical protein VGI18_00960 [Burkholderiales bacterium]|jgi:hypothetical protein